MSELKKIPNVGKRTERDLLAMGYATIASLKGKSGEALYAEECALRGFALDRCQLYLLRAVAYWVNDPSPAREKCAWHLWKDEFALPSPCGAVCAQCASYPAHCGGCRKTEGKAPWLRYTGAERCPVYVCAAEQGRNNCGGCPALPCEKFTKDPTISEVQNAENLRKMLKNLRDANG